jgi:peptidyl-dipeptidase A
VALVPVYYQNYELGYLVSAQVIDRIVRHTGGFAGRRAAGDWLKERFFRPGARQEWSAHIASATGEALDPRFFVDRMR